MSTSDSTSTGATSTDSPATAEAGVEVWADFVCPWCYIGKRRLDLAMEATGIVLPVRHRAFQLDPQARTEGELASDMLARKYSVSPDQAQAMQQNVSDVAASVGLEYHLDRTLTGNTRDAHRLVQWAQSRGDASNLIDAIYRAYFTDGLPVFTPDDLVPIAEAQGYDGDEVRRVLASGEWWTEVMEDQQEASALGANGVPFFVLDRRLGISGAQPAEVFESALRQAAEAG